MLRPGRWIFLMFLLLLAGCGLSEDSVEQSLGADDPSLVSTPQPQVEQTVSVIYATETANPSPTPSATPTLPPTETPTSTPEPVYIGVSAPTNCRVGPGVRYQKTGTLLIEATAEVVAKSSTLNFWYIANPDRSGEYCWLWGKYASIEGDAEVLPVYTPPPSPTPSPAFTMSLDGFFTCEGDEYIVFKIHNPTQITYMTAQRHLIDLDTSKDLYGPALDRYPFAPGPRDCPPGHENEIYPDRVAYIYVPLRGAESGHGVRAIIMVCTEDYLGGDCWANAADIRIP
ncbi:MAG: hypothetical protein BMS9Abin28_0210 [Anaerolineae bacterium]|nr:MAG: hypothetical protein BMS9Abin28_0210 [Anaerolineae bacterium]